MNAWYACPKTIVKSEKNMSFKQIKSHEILMQCKDWSMKQLILILTISSLQFSVCLLKWGIFFSDFTSVWGDRHIMYSMRQLFIYT